MDCIVVPRTQAVQGGGCWRPLAPRRPVPSLVVKIAPLAFAVATCARGSGQLTAASARRPDRCRPARPPRQFATGKGAERSRSEAEWEVLVSEDVAYLRYYMSFVRRIPTFIEC